MTLNLPDNPSKAREPGEAREKSGQSDSAYLLAHMGLIVRITLLAGAILIVLLYLWSDGALDLWFMLIIAFWLAGFALLLSAGFVRRVTRPVGELADRLAKVDITRPRLSLMPLPPAHRRDEVGLIIRAVNQLLLRLDGSLARERLASVRVNEHEVQLRHLFGSASDGIFVLDSGFTIERCNRAAAGLLVLHETELAGRAFADFLSEDAREALLERIGGLTALDPPLTCRTRLSGPRGLDIPISLSVAAFHSATRRSYIVACRDIAIVEAAEKSLVVSESRLKLAVRATRSAIWDETFGAAPFFWWSDELAPMLGFAADELRPSAESRLGLIHPEDVEWVKTSTARYLSREIAEYDVEFRMRQKDGSWLWIADRGVAEWATDGTPARFIGVMSDCTERKRFEQQMMYMATHDPLTSLPNRTLLIDRLGQALGQGARKGLMVGVLLVDIDRFKLINDSLGHEVGDQLVQAMADRLKQSLRPADTLARLAVDEFVVLCGDLSTPQEAARVAKRLLSSLSQHFMVDGHQLTISVSIGISISPADGATPEDMLRHADTAMHSAKSQGGHCHRFFTADMDKESVNRLTLERQLIEAIDRQQFVLHYQPKIDIKSGAPMGFEALIRWPHRKLGNISPVNFIPVAEETGQIIAIGEWVIREALSQICAWRDKGLAPLPVAVNISGKQLVTGGIDELILRLLREYNVSPKLLEIEITESAVMTRLDKILPALQNLRYSGVGISLDDFGTGYSSLSYLRQLPISVLKIDRSFVRDVPHKAEANSVAGIILAVARQLGLKVVAEGIETQEQLEFLRQHECDTAQGWLFYKALPPDQAESLLLPKAP